MKLRKILCITLALSMIISLLTACGGGSSTSSTTVAKSGKVFLIPVGFNLGAYKLIFKDSLFMRNIANTPLLTITNTIMLVAIALLTCYALQSKYCKHVKLKTLFILIPMYFGGGMIPSYILINTWLNLRDNYLALILPVITSPFLSAIFTS